MMMVVLEVLARFVTIPKEEAFDVFAFDEPLSFLSLLSLFYLGSNKSSQVILSRFTLQTSGLSTFN